MSETGSDTMVADDSEDSALWLTAHNLSEQETNKVMAALNSAFEEYDLDCPVVLTDDEIGFVTEDYLESLSETIETALEELRDADESHEAQFGVTD